jgi:hypothetical protein
MKVFYNAKLQAEITNWTGGNKAYAAFKAVQRQKIVSGKLSTSVLYIFCVPAYFCGSVIKDRLLCVIRKITNTGVDLNKRSVAIDSLIVLTAFIT